MDYFDARYFDNSAVELSSAHGSCTQEVATPVGTPAKEAESHLSVSVSTAFQPGKEVDQCLPDLILVSSDNVFFHAHSQILLPTSDNAFGGLLLPHLESLKQPSTYPLISMPENANMVNVVLHTIYGMSCQQYNPPLHTLLEAVGILRKYGIPLDRYIASTTPLFDHILAQAPRRPLDAFMTAAEYQLHVLAVAISTHLISYDLSSITDDQARHMGAVYLKRLFDFHQRRVDTIKKLVLTPPEQHPPTVDCGFVDQKKLTRAWALAAASLTWDAKADMSSSLIQASLGSLTSQLSCSLCQGELNKRIKDIVLQWSLTPRTIL